MLKIKSILMSLLAVAALASCSNENDDITDGGEKETTMWLTCRLA